jgi:hypothetical protein
MKHGKEPSPGSAAEFTDSDTRAVTAYTTCWEIYSTSRFTLTVQVFFIDFESSTAIQRNVYGSQTDMGSCSGKGCKGWLPPVLCEGHGSAHKTQISV